jgi:hypothetical protein
MNKEKTVDELLDELGWGWLPFAVAGFNIALYLLGGWLIGW